MAICLPESFFFLFILSIVSMFLIGLYLLRIKVKEGKSSIPISVDITGNLSRASNPNNGLFPSRVYQTTDNYAYDAQVVGYIYNSTSRFPLYSNRRNNYYYYYVIDDTRNSIKIPFDKNTKHEEIYDGDTLNIPELGGTFTAKIYITQGMVYTPYV